jgi:hypothetical protein
MRASAGSDDGAWHLPDGEAYYAWAVRLHTTTERTPQEIHELGLAEVARIQAEMREILRSQGIDASDLAGAVRELGREPRFLFPDTEAGREQLLAGYQAIIEDANTRLPALFGRLPRAQVEVQRVPVFKQQGAARGYYDMPPFDGSRPGVFYANLRTPLNRSSGCARSPTTRRFPGIISRSRSRRRCRACRSSGAWCPSRPSSRAGRSTPSDSPPRAASIRRRSTGSASWWPRSFAPRGWSSTPASTPCAGRASRRSTTCWRTRRSSRRKWWPRSSATS